MPAPPPPDAPDLPTQDAIALSVSFEPSPSGFLLCGFGIPGFAFSISIPPFDFPPPFPPNLNLFLSLACDLEDPLDAELSFGGGRVSPPTIDPDEKDT